MADQGDFCVRFWGVRGTVPCPGPKTVNYGGNTSCIEITCGERRLIFDAGTGLRALGASLAGSSGHHAHIFLTHTHFDHINGFPFFRPAYDPSNCFEVWAGHLTGKPGGVQAVLAKLMSGPLFPVPLDIMHACIAYNDFAVGERLTMLPGITIDTAPLNHPQDATGYRVNYAGKSICYVTDTEHVEGKLDANILRLIDGSDLVIYDATYTEEEYPRYRTWGHSTWQEGVKLCEAAHAGTLVAFHHDPDHDDAVMDGIAQALQQRRPGSVVAKEGMVLRP
ncbi:MAG: MBL fold metallo-hydrolase [Oscillatoriales cyanobacterium RU_3_3]|nr:MBL fold metallo-hydrolase [Oscillatoriales cyanobacterium RU_3_3]